MRKLLENTQNKRGRLLAVFMTFAMLFSSVSNGAEAAKKLKVTSPKTVTVNGSITIKTNIKCSFKSSNKKIATVNSKGVVKGKRAGSVKITVTAKKDKQKKTVKITVKKAKAVATKTPGTAAPNVNVTQPPQSNVTQSPTHGASEDVSQSPDVPDTPTPSVAPPRNTVTPSPNPSATKQPIGITAEYEGKIPINRELSNEAAAERMLIDATITVKLRYDDNTEEEVRPLELYVDQVIVEENGIKYVEATVKYEEFSTVLKVELVDVPKDVLYPIYISCSYVGDILKKNQIPNLEDIKTQAIMVDQSITDVSSTQIRIADIEDLYETEGNKEYQFMIVQDYYFDFNGQVLHAAEGDLLYIPYE